MLYEYTCIYGKQTNKYILCILTVGYMSVNVQKYKYLFIFFTVEEGNAGNQKSCFWIISCQEQCMGIQSFCIWKLWETHKLK